MVRKAEHVGRSPSRNVLRRNVLRLMMVSLLVIHLSSCSGEDVDRKAPDDGASPAPAISYLVIKNMTPTDLVEVRVHPNRAYQETANLLEEPLSSDENGQFTWCGHGTYYITIMRPRLRADGSRILAYTTSLPISLVESEHTYLLEVYDQRFHFNPYPSGITKGECPYEWDFQLVLPTDHREFPLFEMTI